MDHGKITAKRDIRWARPQGRPVPRRAQRRRIGKAQHLLDTVKFGVARRRCCKTKLQHAPEPRFVVCLRPARRERGKGKCRRAVAGLCGHRDVVLRQRQHADSSALRDVGRAGMAMTRSMSGLPSMIPAVPANTSTSIRHAATPRRRLRISGVVSSTSPRRRSETTRMRGMAGIRLTQSCRLSRWPRATHAVRRAGLPASSIGLAAARPTPASARRHPCRRAMTWTWSCATTLPSAAMLSLSQPVTSLSARDGVGDLADQLRLLARRRGR